MRQRGMILVYGLVALAVIAAAWGALSWHAGVHFARGQADRQAEWDRDTIANERIAAARRAAVTAALQAEKVKTAAAEELARIHEINWRRARDEARRNGKPLGSCQGEGSSARPAGVAGPVAGEPAGEGLRAPGVGGADRGGVALHWRFVGLYDGAHTGPDGQPLYRAQVDHALAPGRADTPSPYGLDELIDAHGENARRFGACLRAFDDAMRKLDAAAEAWDRVGK